VITGQLRTEQAGHEYIKVPPPSLPPIILLYVYTAPERSASPSLEQLVVAIFGTSP
jgi:hypothetical protein